MRDALVGIAVGVAALAAGGVGAAKGPVPCPTGTLPFEANSVGRAAVAALADDKAANKPLVTGASFAQFAGVRGTTAKVWCGRTVWQRTVVVQILDRTFLPAESASQRVVFVSRFAGGYRVWARAH